MERDRERIGQRKVKSKRESGKQRGIGKRWRKEEKDTQRGKERKRGEKGRISLKTVWNT